MNDNLDNSWGREEWKRKVWPLLFPLSLFAHMDHVHFSKPELRIDDLLLKQQRVRGEMLYKALLSEHVSEYLLFLCVLLLLLLLLRLRRFQQDDLSHYELICLHLNSSPCQLLGGVVILAVCVSAGSTAENYCTLRGMQAEHTHAHTHARKHTQPPNDLPCSKMHECSQNNQLQKYCENSTKLHEFAVQLTSRLYGCSFYQIYSSSR